MPFDFALLRRGVTEEQYDSAPRIFALTQKKREIRTVSGEVVGRMTMTKRGVETEHPTRAPAAFETWHEAYIYLTGLDFSRAEVDVSEVREGFSGAMPNKKTGLAPDTAREWVAMDRGPGISTFRDVAAQLPWHHRAAFSLHIGKDFAKFTLAEYSDLIYAAAWCRAYRKSMEDYLNAGFYGVPERAEQLAFAA